MTDQELADFAFYAKQFTDAYNERQRARGKRQRLDVMDAVEVLHAIGREAVRLERGGTAVTRRGSGAV